MNILLNPTAPRERQDFESYRDAAGFRALETALRTMAPAEVIDEIEAAKLRGRGGARFATARKWRLAAEQRASEKHVIANGGEHEPGSGKDEYLLCYHPFAVLEGLLLCGYATGATTGWMYLIEDMAEPIASVQQAIDELRTSGLMGNEILDSRFSFDIRIHTAPTTYVAGEETAAIDAIEGGEGKPREKPPYPGHSGLFGRPTTVNNVETLAHVPWILRHGADAYCAIGTEESTGTMLFTLGKDVENPGIYELPFGSTYRDLIWDGGGGPLGGRDVLAILPAMSAAFLGPEHLDTPISYEGFAELGTSPGCGGVHLFLDGDDIVARTLEIARFFMSAQCGQCPECRMETNQFVHILSGVMAGKRGDFLGQLTKIADFTRGKGKCALIEMAAAPVLSAATLFRNEFEAKATE